MEGWTTVVTKTDENGKPSGGYLIPPGVPQEAIDRFLWGPHAYLLPPTGEHLTEEDLPKEIFGYPVKLV